MKNGGGWSDNGIQVEQTGEVHECLIQNNVGISGIFTVER